MRTQSWKILACTAGLITLLVYLRALTCDFVNFDDPQYVYENPAIRVLDWRFVSEAFTTSYMGWWMPLTWISLAIDYHFWGGNPFGYHLSNIVIHAVNAGLAVLIADSLFRWDEAATLRYLHPSTLLLAALFWSLHPLRVESVAWVTERKDVLNGLFSLVAILCYLRHVRARGLQLARFGGVGAYVLSLVFFLLSLTAKPVSVVLPLMFLVLDWYPLNRLQWGTARAIVMEKIPFFLLSALVSVATVYFAAGETILVTLEEFPLGRRALVAGYALVEYVRMTIWPSGLVHFYLIPREFPLSYYLYPVLVVVFTLCCIRYRSRYPSLLAGWLLFLLPLLPVIGFLQNGAQSHADRFTYLPSLLPGILVIAGAATFYQRFAGRLPRYAAVFITVAVISVPVAHAALSVELIGAWRNSETLWSRLITVRPIGRAYYYRGEYLLRKGRYAEAAADFATSIDMAGGAGNPDLHNLHAYRGDALSKGGRYNEAVDEFTAAIRLRPIANYYYHRGVALRGMGRLAEAEEDFGRAGDDTAPVGWRNLR